MTTPKSTSPAAIVFGSMRMLEYNYTKAYWVDLFKALHDSGVTTFHSSSEYESFSFFCEVLSVFHQQYPEKEIQHIVKLAEPSFHEHQFNEKQLFDKIEYYCKSLKSTKLFGIQWMWRADLQNNQQRLENFKTQYPIIEQSVKALKNKNKIDNFFCFPYDVNFAKEAIQKSAVDGLIVYRNILETEHDEALNLAASLHKKSYILRPLFAGKALENQEKSPRELVRWALDFPDVEAAIISISSISKFKEII